MGNQNFNGSKQHHSNINVDRGLSYAKNSVLQRSVNDTANFFIREAIAKNLDELKSFSSSKVFCIADLGCSIGPNTFLAIQNILKAVEQKFNNSTLKEFQVFFNDVVTNDFNTLFKSIPTSRNYFAAGVPGSFHGRLFPSASLHFLYSSFALQWLSRVPDEVTDKSSPCWNKGNIYYSHAGDDQVAEAYAKRFAEDLKWLLDARGKEVVEGGLVAIVIPARANGVPHSKVAFNMTYNLLGTCLLDLVKKGLVDEEKIDSFNIPVYNPSIEELEIAVERNGCFTLESIEPLPWKPPSGNLLQGVLLSNCMRALMEASVREHFGNHILDPLFELYTKKVQEQHHDIAAADVLYAFVLLKRKSFDL